MPLFPRIPQPVSENGDTPEARKGKGYEWIVEKFVAMANDIRKLREQAMYDEDQGEFRAIYHSAALAAAAPVGTRTSIESNPIKPGTEFRIERVIVTGGVSGGRANLYIGPGEKPENRFDILDYSLESGDGATGAVGSPSYSQDMIVRAGQTILVVFYNKEVPAAASQIGFTAWGRLVAEKPQGLAVG
jgi:hypothetical protein